MASREDYRDAEREQAAREKGRTIPHYAKKVVRKLASPARRTGTTPSKRAAK